MKKLTILVKLTFLTAGFMVLTGIIPVSGQKPPKLPGCKTTVACSGWWNCYCGDPECTGCSIPNGGGSCGYCSR
jgi:hypothetical protein